MTRSRVVRDLAALVAERPEILTKSLHPRVDRTGGPEACWPFLGDTSNRAGYGRIEVSYGPRTARRRFRVLAHRLAHFAASGEQPENVRHSCDNPPCCNPAHLLAGDLSSNMLDAVARGRHAQTRRTHCRNGHAYTAGNIIWETTPVGNPGRRCRTCRLASRHAAQDRR